ncbi:D-inositol-3-phosphate glycosyltransferase [Gordonia sp. CPCC 205333]|uniref:D-inositol-3-phosphate glycosyltransferase n=1 Tax=Gordonia sp. CPCC 205333 TaxID=3140790 RepID=UPI003AF35FF9
MSLPAKPRRVALISVHTSPLAQPGTGDAGGLNVYVAQTAQRLAKRGIDVEIFTRATSSAQPPIEYPRPGVMVRNIAAGPYEGLDKRDLPAQLCAFAAGVQRAEATQRPGYYDLVHSHYWLSGQVGWLVRDRWGVPLVHTAHTLAAVKNAALAEGDTAEPMLRVIGEQQVIDEADRLVANTETEASQLVSLYHADPSRIDVVTPGADLDCYSPGSRDAARAALGIAIDETVVTFVGRIQPLKAPDVLLSAAAPIIAAADRGERPKLRVLVVGGPSGSGLEKPTALIDLADRLGISDAVTFLPPQPPSSLTTVYRASDVVAVPSYSESFGLVAIEAQACGIPVIAADVGGLGVAVDNGRTGVLVAGHAIGDWTNALEKLLDQPAERAAMGSAAHKHAQQFSWDHTADQLLDSYARAMSSFAAAHGIERSHRRWLRRRLTRTGV